MRSTIRKAVVVCAAAGLLALPPTIAQAQDANFPAGGGTILGFGAAKATSTQIFVQYLGFEAAYTDQLRFSVLFGGTEYELFTNQTTAIGTIFSLNDLIGGASFTPGTEIVFSMFVDAPDGDPSDNQQYYTGDPSRNPDGLDHALWATYDDTGVYNGTTVSFNRQIGFEDILGGGDEDFDDLVFATSGVEVVPEPVSLLLMATGLIGIAGFAYRRRNSGIESDVA